MCVTGNLNLLGFVRCSTARHRYFVLSLHNLHFCFLSVALEGADKPGQVIRRAWYPHAVWEPCVDLGLASCSSSVPFYSDMGKLLCSLHCHTRYEKGGHGTLPPLPKNGMLYKSVTRNNSEHRRRGALKGHSLEVGGGAPPWRSSVKSPLWLQPYSVEH